MKIAKCVKKKKKGKNQNNAKFSAALWTTRGDTRARTSGVTGATGILRLLINSQLLINQAFRTAPPAWR